MNLLTKIKNWMGGNEQSLARFISICAVITVFSLTSTKVLLSQAAYKRHIISARKDAVKALNTDLSNSDKLKSEYQNFEGTGPKNIIGGQNTTNTTAVPPDGNNSRIVLDALPSTYDFPALISSLSKIMSSNGFSSPSIGGSDQSATIKSDPSPNPQPVEIPLTLSGTNSQQNVQNIIKDLERSIRPFDITRLSLQGSDSAMSFSATATTYFQPAKTLNITDKAVN